MKRLSWELLVALAVLLAPSLSGAQEMAMHDRWVLGYLAFDEFEIAPGADERPLELDALAWVGGDVSKVWLALTGEHETRGRSGSLEAQLQYGRAVSPFWDVQAGGRLDREYGEGDSATRALLALGVQGLAPYWFEVTSELFISTSGDVSARLQAAYDLLITQRLILEPEVEADIAVSDVPAFAVRSGLDGLELSARLRFEIVRELAPYLGIVWHRDGLPAAQGVDALVVSETALVLGVRWWY